MSARDKRIDAYITDSRPFAKPILKRLRALVHKACPAVEETMKWNFPHFDYRGEMMCSMAAFTHHCSFGFWKASLMKDPVLMTNARSEAAMGHLGKIMSVKDLPSDKKLIAYVREAARLNDEGVKVKKTPISKEKKKLTIPSYFSSAMKKNARVASIFEAFSYSNKKEYIEWVTEAKTAATRLRRLETAVQWIAEGKVRNWKYLKK